MIKRDVVVTRAASDAIKRGHPWVWREAITRGGQATAGVLAGEVVRIVGQDGAELGAGVFDPGSPIAVRVWAHGGTKLDDALIEERIDRALAIRAKLFEDGATTAYRLMHGEGDRTPGLVVDRYGHVAVLRIDGAGADAFAARVGPILWRALEKGGVKTLVKRAAARGGEVESDVLYGPPPPDTIEVAEHGVPFVVDLAKGQKTGAFLDQRENRRRVGELAAARSNKESPTRVLNLFSYAGGFSLRAAIGGAKVTSVDVAAQAHATAQASFRLAKVDPAAHEFVAADAFAFLAGAKQRGKTWDIVVSDPPSFAPNEKSKPRAMTAYRSLHRACVDVLAKGGVFCAASCSSHVSAEDFAGTLDDAALGRGDLRVMETYGHPPDHPTLAAWPEGRYLKLAVLA